nr:MAG TPA: hypothetical protein [Caudoviricetes sp.]
MILSSVSCGNVQVSRTNQAFAISASPTVLTSYLSDIWELLSS